MFLECVEGLFVCLFVYCVAVVLVSVFVLQLMPLFL